MQNKSLDEQLADALHLPPERRRFARAQNNRQQERGTVRQNDLFRYFYARPQNPPRRGDGQDHINIYTRCETDLGAALYCETALEFRHSLLGRCASVKAAWDFLAFGANNRRLLLAPTQARRKMLNGLQAKEFACADYIFMDLAWSQVNNHPMLKQAIIESTLPFDSYRIDGAMALSSRLPFSRRLIEAHEIIRAALKNNQEPDFSAYAEGKTREEIFAQFHEQVQIPESRSSRKNNSLLRALDRMPVHTAPKKPTNNKRPLPPVNTTPDVVTGTHRLNYVLQAATGERVAIQPNDIRFTELADDLNRYLNRIVSNDQIPKNKMLKEVEASVGVYFDLRQDDVFQAVRSEDDSVKPDLAVEVSFVDNRLDATAFIFNNTEAAEQAAPEPVTTVDRVDIPVESLDNSVDVLLDEAGNDCGSTTEAETVDEGPFDLQGNYFYLKSENGDTIDVPTDFVKKYLVENDFSWNNFGNRLINMLQSSVQLTIDDRINSESGLAQVVLMIGAETNSYETVFHVRVLKTEEQIAKLAEKTFLITDEEVDDLNFKVATDRYDSLDSPSPVFLQLTHEGETKF